MNLNGGEDVDGKESFEDKLDHDIDEVRDELHDEYVNDMNHHLEGISRKDSEVEEGGEDGTSSEVTESSESYEDAGTGMVYAIETKSESESQSEVESEVEDERQDHTENSEPIDEVEESSDEQFRNRVIRQESPEAEQEEYTAFESAEDAEKQGLQRHESSEPTGETEPEVSKGETSQEDQPELEHEESRECTSDDGLDSVEVHEESEVESDLEYSHEMEGSSDASEAHDEPEVDELEHPNEPDVESQNETESQEVSDDVRSNVESSEMEIKDSEVDEVSEHEISEAEDFPEELVDFVKRVQDILENEMDVDDGYDYVQDPLTGEIQRVPKILSEYESEEQKRRRKLCNLFAKLSEEEREQFKQIVREKAETEEERSAEEIERQWIRVVKTTGIIREDTIQKEDTDTTPQRIAQIDSKEKFDRVQTNYSHLKMNKNHEKEHRTISRYFERKRNGENVAKPPVIEKLERLELRRIYVIVNGKHPDVPLESITDFNKLLKKNPECKKEPKFPEHYRKTKVYFAVRNDWSKMEKELAAEYKVSESTIGNYRRGDRESRLVSKLRNSEENRIIRDWARIHQLDEKTVENLKRISPTKIEQAIENRTRDTHPIQPNPIDELEKQIATNLESLSKVTVSDVSSLSSNQVSEIVERLKATEGIHVGAIDGKVYIWKPDLNRDDMLNVWKKVYFYFDVREISKMVEEVGTQLKLGGTQYKRAQNLNRLLTQITSSSDVMKIDDSRSRIVGEALHFNRDVLGLHSKDLEGIVNKVSGWNGVGGIPNPKFPEGKELEIERARLYAILKSDGSMGHDRTLGYTETHLDRFEIVEKGLQAWGDIKLSRYKKHAYETRFPSPFWDALHFWGFPLGDKMMHNERLGLDIDQLPLEAVRKYISELTPEDGNFHSTTGFSWSRSVVLRAGKKGDEYGFKSLIPPKLASFVKENGSHDVEKQRKVLRISKLEELTKDSNPLISSKAKELERITKASPSKLIEDEIKMVQRLGIETSLEPRVIRFSLRTGRVSVYWSASTASRRDDEIWAITCPPNDIKKRRIVRKWLKERNSTIDDTKRKLRKNNIPYDEWWI
jgi:hypothetical protein